MKDDDTTRGQVVIHGFVCNVSAETEAAVQPPEPQIFNANTLFSGVGGMHRIGKKGQTAPEKGKDVT